MILGLTGDLVLKIWRNRWIGFYWQIRLALFRQIPHDIIRLVKDLISFGQLTHFPKFSQNVS